MDKQRRLILLAGLGSLGCTFLGCGAKPPRQIYDNRPSYQEDISSVLMSQDQRQLVFLGRAHHYIFDAPQVLVDTLSSSFHPYVTAFPFPFSVAEDNSIQGLCALTVSADAPTEHKTEALTRGYREIPGGALQTQVALKGTRYDATHFVAPGFVTKLNRTYAFKIYVPSQNVAVASQTPVYSDSAKTILQIGLLPLFLVTGLVIVAECAGHYRCR